MPYNKGNGANEAHTTTDLRQRIAVLEDALAQALQHQELLQSIFDTLPQAIFWKDQQLIYQGCNQAFATIAGVGAPAHIVGKTDYDLPWSRSEAERSHTSDQRVIECDRAERDIVKPQLQSDGTQTWQRTSKIPLHNADGQITGMLGTYEDITQHVERERQLEAAFNSSYQFIGLLQPDGILLRINRAVTQVTGQNMDALGSIHFADAPWWPDESVRTSVQQAIRQASSGEHIQYQTVVNTLGNQQLKIDISLRPIQDETGQVVFVLAEGRDITAQKQNETAQKQNEAELRVYQQVVEQALDGIAMVDPNGVIIYANAAYSRMLGYESAVGLTNADVTPPNDTDRVTEVGNHLMQHGTYQGHYRYQRPDGSTFPAQLSVFLIDESPDASMFAAAMMRDISEQVEREHELRLFKTLIDNAPDGVAVVDTQTNVLYVNTAYKTMTGYGDELLDMQASVLVVEEEKITVTEALEELSEQRHLSLTTKYRRKDGSIFPVENSIFVMEDESGQPLLTGFVRDVTERHQREAALRHAEARQRALLNAMPDIMFVLNSENTYIDYWGAPGDSLLPPEQFMGKRNEDILPPELAQLFQDAITETLCTRETLHIEYTVPYNDILNHYETRISAIDDDNVLALVRNITRRKQQEAELRQFKALVENAPDGIVLTNPQGIVTYVNPAFGRLYGYEDTSVGMAIPDFFPPTEQEELGAVLQHLLKHGLWQGILHHQRKDGSIFVGEEDTLTICNEQGEIQALGAIVRDITQRKAQEEELRVFETMVQHAPDGIGYAKTDGTIVSANPAYRTLMGLPTPVGMSFGDSFSGQHREFALQEFGRVLTEGQVQTVLTLQLPDSSATNVATTGVLVCDANGQPQGVVGIFRDLTEQQQAEAERATLQQQVIDAQREALRELSTPLIPITDTTVVMPLVGAIDSRRAQQVLETLLAGVAQHRAELVILDITGVQVVDTQVAQSFIQAAQAVKLLGAQVMLTGIQPQIAQTLVHLGVDLQGIVTHSSLQSGITYALRSERASV